MGGTAGGPQGGAGAGGSAGDGMGGMSASAGADPGAGMGGSTAGAPNGGAGTGGMEPVEPPTCSGCARLSVPLAAQADHANFAITLSGTMNFSSAVLTARIYKQAGSGGQFKFYVQHSGTPDFNQLFQNTPVELSSFSGWLDVTWNVGTQQASYDKTIVGRVGVQVTGGGSTSWTNPTLVYVDSITVTGVTAGPWRFETSGSISTTPATSGATGVLFCNSGDSPVSGSAVSWYSRE
jgi:hypothetical protein